MLRRHPPEHVSQTPFTPRPAPFSGATPLLADAAELSGSIVRLMGMDLTGNGRPGVSELRHWYRTTFVEFSRLAWKVQSLKTKTNPSPAEIEAALLQLEQARVAHNHARDLLAYTILRPGRPVSLSAAGDSYGMRVKRVAELLWEFEGRREGKADDHWFRAERIVQHATAAQ